MGVKVKEEKKKSHRKSIDDEDEEAREVRFQESSQVHKMICIMSRTARYHQFIHFFFTYNFSYYSNDYCAQLQTLEESKYDQQKNKS